MKKLVLVEAISMHRMRYCVEVEDDIDHALDSHTAGDLDDGNEMSQEHMGEFTISHREITEEEYLKIFDEDNDYLKDWTDEQKKQFIHRIDYKE
jgi:hypothetical protein